MLVFRGVYNIHWSSVCNQTLKDSNGFHDAKAINTIKPTWEARWLFSFGLGFVCFLYVSANPPYWSSPRQKKDILMQIHQLPALRLTDCWLVRLILHNTKCETAVFHPLPKKDKPWRLVVLQEIRVWAESLRPGVKVQVSGIQDETNCISSWWFQPLWEILVKMEIFPK